MRDAKKWRVRTCVIFNPAARGTKARRFRRYLDEIGTQSTLKLTTAPGDARRLSAEAVGEGFETVVAAGGDGTVNEVLNGFGDVPQGFERARLGVLPLGTVNVFAREMGVAFQVRRAWATICAGRETRIDLPYAEYRHAGATQRRSFVQLAGAGLDARAIELVHWEVKKQVGPLAYVLAGLHALLEEPRRVKAIIGPHSHTGGLVLIGNGQRYGGRFRVFPQANLRDGLLDVCVFQEVNWLTLAHCGPHLLLRSRLPSSAVKAFQVETLELTGNGNPAAAFEIDGELIGPLPASFAISRLGLRVIVP